MRIEWVSQVLVAGSLLLAAACSQHAITNQGTVLTLWKHQAGKVEEAANRALIDRFNASQDKWKVHAQSIPQSSYGDAIIVSALAGQMPCLLTVDHPMVPSFVWARHLRPIEPLVARQTLRGVSPAGLGRFAGHVYSVGQFDAALVLYTRRSTLQRISARMPTLAAPWSRGEFDKILSDLHTLSQFSYPLDLSTRDPNPDWWAYAFSPMLQSFGGDLIDRRSLLSAEHVLNGPEAIEWGRWFQSLFRNHYVNRREPDDQSFPAGRSAVAYSGNWWAPNYERIVGDDLLILPPPDFGHGTVIGGGSWQWAISATCQQPQGAAAFIDFLMQPAEVAAMSEAAGMIPVTEAGAALTTRFREGASWRVFYDLMTRYARARPATPAFVPLAKAYTKASRDIMDGRDVRDALDDAADDIARVIQDNDGYRVDGVSRATQ